MARCSVASGYIGSSARSHATISLASSMTAAEDPSGGLKTRPTPRACRGHTSPAAPATLATGGRGIGACAGKVFSPPSHVVEPDPERLVRRSDLIEQVALVELGDPVDHPIRFARPIARLLNTKTDRCDLTTRLVVIEVDLDRTPLQQPKLRDRYILSPVSFQLHAGTEVSAMEHTRTSICTNARTSTQTHTEWLVAHQTLPSCWTSLRRRSKQRLTRIHDGSAPPSELPAVFIPSLQTKHYQQGHSTFPGFRIDPGKTDMKTPATCDG